MSQETDKLISFTTPRAVAGLERIVGDAVQSWFGGIGLMPNGQSVRPQLFF